MGFTPDECQQITEIGIQYAVSGAGVGPIELGLLIMRLRSGARELVASDDCDIIAKEKMETARNDKSKCA